MWIEFKRWENVMLCSTINLCWDLNNLNAFDRLLYITIEYDRFLFWLKNRIFWENVRQFNVLMGIFVIINYSTYYDV